MSICGNFEVDFVARHPASNEIGVKWIAANDIDKYITVYVKPLEETSTIETRLYVPEEYKPSELFAILSQEKRLEAISASIGSLEEFLSTRLNAEEPVPSVELLMEEPLKVEAPKEILEKKSPARLLDDDEIALLLFEVSKTIRKMIIPTKLLKVLIFNSFERFFQGIPSNLLSARMAQIVQELVNEGYLHPVFPSSQIDLSVPFAYGFESKGKRTIYQLGGKIGNAAAVVPEIEEIIVAFDALPRMVVRNRSNVMHWQELLQVELKVMEYEYLFRELKKIYKILDQYESFNSLMNKFIAANDFYGIQKIIAVIAHMDVLASRVISFHEDIKARIAKK